MYGSLSQPTLKSETLWGATGLILLKFQYKSLYHFLLNFCGGIFGYWHWNSEAFEYWSYWTFRTPKRGIYFRHFHQENQNGKIRFIINLKPLNQYLTYAHFKMQHLDFVSELVNKDVWFASIDLTDAYFAVSIHQSYRKLLKFLWRGELYRFWYFSKPILLYQAM